VDPVAQQQDGDGYAPMAQAVADELRRAIFDGDLRPGEPVRQEAVALAHGVSRIPVREALRQLESEGLVVIRPHSGARVATLDFAECEEIYKMRERLEPLAFAESVAHIGAEDVEQARQLARDVEAAKGDPALWLQCDRTFHLACYAGVPTPRLLRTIVGFWNTTQPYRRILLTTFADEDYELQHSEHRLMVDFLASGRARAGEDLVRMHIERSRLRLARNRELFDR
jgi:DNA-binding GntR family transcriptional regulator